MDGESLQFDGPFDGEEFLRTLTSRPGVYRMLDQHDKILYVGKARNLKKRVSSYFRQSGLAPKTQALMKQVQSVDVTVTHTESEALILENNLIKENRPRYNVLLRDDKSYPYIYLSSEDSFPRLSLHRGARRARALYGIDLHDHHVLAVGLAVEREQHRVAHVAAIPIRHAVNLDGLEDER